MIGGKEPIVLTRLQTGNDVLPEFLSATLLPGRAMQIFQVTAYIPGRGITDLLVSPTLEQAATMMTGTGDDQYGNLNHKFGGAFLYPSPIASADTTPRTSRRSRPAGMDTP